MTLITSSYIDIILYTLIIDMNKLEKVQRRLLHESERS